MTPLEDDSHQMSLFEEPEVETVGMSEEDVKNVIDTYVDNAITWNQTEVAQQRADAISYYLGEPLGNEVEGKSQVVSRDVMETIDWIMPSLMKVFTSGDTVVEFTPQNMDDVAQAEQETEYVNWLFMRKNPGFTILHDWFQDALMVKNGILKVYIDEDEFPEFNKFRGLSEPMVTEILADPLNELVGHTPNGDGTHDIQVKKSNKRRQIRVCNVPPEEFLIEDEARSIEDAQFVAHRPLVTRSYLASMGVPGDVLDSLQYESWDDVSGAPEALSRDAMDGTGTSGYHNYSPEEANKKIRISDCFVNLDVDGDGIAELRHIIKVGDYLLLNEETPDKPFADLASHRIAHKFHGMSVFDRIKDIQQIRSVLMRNILDNLYNVNNGRYACIEGQVNLDDLLTNQSGGVVRVKTQGAIQDLPVPALNPDVYQMLDRLEDVRGKRTGVSDRSRGLDTDTLHSNQAATSVNQMMTASEAQIDLIARMFAETGVKRLFHLIHSYAIRYQDHTEMFKLRGQFVEVNPSDWKDRYDLEVTVGIGNMNKDQQLLHLNRMFEMAQAIVGGGGLGILVTEQNLYNMLSEMTQNAGYKDVDKYWTNPSSPMSQETKSNQEATASEPTPEDIRAQAEMVKAQSEAAKKQADAQKDISEQALKQQEINLRSRELTLQEEQLALEKEKFEWERAKNEAEYELEKTQSRATAIGNGMGGKYL